MKIANILKFAALLMTIAATSTANTLNGFIKEDIIAVSDGAMVASGYIDGKLGKRQPDLVSILRHNNKRWSRTDIAVSNSVATWPNIMAVTPDGHFALVTEPYSQPSEDATAFSEIKRGVTITVLDISNRAAPHVVQEIVAPSSPAGIDIHPQGELVAVSLPFTGEIALYPFKDGKLGEPTLHSIGFEGLDGSFLPEVKWRPDGNFLAVTMGAAARVGFYRYTDGTLKTWGPVMQTAPLPGKGAWTEDGRFFIVTTITATADMAQLGYAQNSSLFAVFEFDDDEKTNSPPRRSNDRRTTYTSPPIQHARIAHVPNGMGYVENFAISPDGSWVVGLNMAASWLPQAHPGRTSYSELTLFAFDKQNGTLEPRGITRMEGVILPQGITFDSTGNTLAVSSFQHDNKQGGSVSFWQLKDGRLSSTGETLKMPRGVHFLMTLPALTPAS